MKRRSFIKHMALASAAVVGGASVVNVGTRGHVDWGKSVPEILKDHQAASNALTLEKLREITDQLAWDALNKGTSVRYVNACPEFTTDLKALPTVTRIKPERFYRGTNVMPDRGRWA